MTLSMRVEKDFRDFLKLLGEKAIKYLIVGGFAYSFHAEPRYTKDIDILVGTSEENAVKLKAAIVEFWGQETELNVSDLQKEDTFVQLGFPPIRIDVITSCAGIEFENAWERRILAKYGDIEIFFISLEDLINNKLATGRDRDLLDAKYLKKIQEAKGK